MIPTTSAAGRQSLSWQHVLLVLSLFPLCAIVLSLYPNGMSNSTPRIQRIESKEPIGRVITAPDGSGTELEQAGTHPNVIGVGDLDRFWIADRYGRQLSYMPPNCGDGLVTSFEYTVRNPDGSWSEIWRCTSPSLGYKIIGYLEKVFKPKSGPPPAPVG